jgi:hypothetical protein
VEMTVWYAGAYAPAYQTVISTEWHIPDIVLIQSFSWWWTHSCPKHVENRNKRTWKRIVCQVGYLQRLLIIVSFNIHILHAYVTTGLITEKYNFSFAILDMSLLWNIFLFAKKASFPRAVLSFISSSIELSVFTVDPSYLNDLTCSVSLFWIFIGLNLSSGTFQIFCFVCVYC